MIFSFTQYFRYCQLIVIVHFKAECLHVFSYFVFRGFSFGFDVWLGEYGTKFLLAVV